MEGLIVDPPIPYVGPIQGGPFGPGKMVIIQGITPVAAYRFNINLQCGPETIPRDDIGMQISIRLLDGYMSLNSLQRGIWGEQQRCDTLPIKRGEKFKIILKCRFRQYKVIINGQHFYDFPQRIPYDRITHLAIDGDVSIIQISYITASEHEEETAGLVGDMIPQTNLPPIQIQTVSDGFELVNANSIATPPPSYEKALQKNEIGFASGKAAGPSYPTTCLYPTNGPSPSKASYPTSAYPTSTPYFPTTPYPTQSNTTASNASTTGIPGSGPYPPPVQFHTIANSFHHGPSSKWAKWTIIIGSALCGFIVSFGFLTVIVIILGN